MAETRVVAVTRMEGYGRQRPMWSIPLLPLRWTLGALAMLGGGTNRWLPGLRGRLDTPLVGLARIRWLLATGDWPRV